MAASRLSPCDPCSFARPDQVVVRHAHLELDVDFNRHVLLGRVKLDVERLDPAANSLILDTRDVNVKKVYLDGSSTELKFNVGSPVKSFGSKLEISLPADCGKCTVNVDYETSPNCTALQWLSPEQTAGKVHPYLFSQCQAIHARSLLPCQDTPAVKMTYSAEISCPKELVALMSAVKGESKLGSTDNNKMVHSFTQKVSIPSYLVAVVVGALESREIGPRSKVWSEKEMVEEAAWEFAETEQMLAAAEDLMGPYLWGVYDLLILPPSFPYGGMENPCLTFVTPTLLAGDRSLASVVAHEITHSWMGNLVTTKTWEHFWLNEGHTVFVERKIGGRMFGEQFRHFEAIGGWKELKYQIEVFGKDNPYTHLVPSLEGPVDPDDAFSSIPYEKGSNFLMYLEQKLGGPDVFEPFLKAYVQKFQHTSLTTDEWKEFLLSFFKDQAAAGVFDDVDWNGWLHTPGMPPVKPVYDTTLAEQCEGLAKRWVEAGEDQLDQFKADDIKSFSSLQVREYLAYLLEQSPLSPGKIAMIDKLYELSGKRNSEIKFRWLRLCIKARIEAVIPKAIDLVNEQGRMKFVRPIYRDLYQWEGAREAAITNFQKTRNSLHSIASTMVAKDLKLA